MNADSYQNNALSIEVGITQEHEDRLTANLRKLKVHLQVMQVVGQKVNTTKRNVYYLEGEELPQTDEVLKSAESVRTRDVTREIHGVLGLVTEVGELVEAFMSYIVDGKPLDLTNVKEELGDISWYLAQVAGACNMQLSEVFESNIRKLQQGRYKDGFTPEVARAVRDVEAERAVIENEVSSRTIGHDGLDVHSVFGDVAAIDTETA